MTEKAGIMPSNAFIGRPTRPTEGELAAELGKAKLLWDQVIVGLADDLQVNGQEWSSYSKKAGWSLRLKRAGRIIVYLSPCPGCFLASFALGGKAVEAARKSRLPEKAIKIMAQARKYAEGTAVRIVVKSPGDAAIVRKLAVIKAEN
ncbi:MAG: DUF3788 domain-containing protein [Acidobacteriia bacterium]|nr:DUF3788 domain-containing protein [Terriglobia bacterium]